MQIGNRIRKHRLQKGLTQKDLGEPRYTHAYVSTIEAGRRNPSQKALQYFARKLGVEAEELRTGRPRDLAAQLELATQEATVAISSGEFLGAEETLSEVESKAARYSLKRIQARARELRALSFERQGKLEDAVALYDSTLSLLSEESPPTHAFATAGKMRCLQFMGEASYAIHLGESLVAVLKRERLEDPSALVELLAPLVTLYFDVGMHRHAAETAKEVEALAVHAPDPGVLGKMHVNVARTHLAQGRYGDAQKSLTQAEAAFRSIHRESEIGVVYLAQGIVLSRKGDLKSARKRLEKARGIFSSTGNALYKANAAAELGRVDRLLGNLESARKALNEAIALLEHGEDTRTLAWTYRELGELLTNDDDRQAEKYLREAILLYERSEEFIELASTHRVMGDVLTARGDNEGGCAMYREGILVAERSL
ncbi:MAG: tetratricopeptide repeat protein [Actinobacteria bacterium]|nr:tetratricopeptide repeat protein [Actinomycetota bacterium]